MSGATRLMASGGESGVYGVEGKRVVRSWSGGGGRCIWGQGGQGGSNGGDGDAGTSHDATVHSRHVTRWSVGGQGSGAVELPRIPGLSLAPGRGGEPDGIWGGGGGGVRVSGGPEWIDKNCGEGFGGGWGKDRTEQGGGGPNGVVIIYI